MKATFIALYVLAMFVLSMLVWRVIKVVIGDYSDKITERVAIPTEQAAKLVTDYDFNKNYYRKYNILVHGKVSFFKTETTRDTISSSITSQ